jgi:alpha-beta hydrolase superfamily lysophospholipase
MIVDDGIATGATARAACGVARAQGAARVVVATPVAPGSMTADSLGADDLVCVERPPWFRAVGLHYRDFAAVSDHEVAELLAAAHRPTVTRDVQVPLEEATLSATVSVPDRPLGVVLFAHGSGSSRHSPRNRYVADVLVRAGLATVLLDLLTPAEERSRRLVFDVPMLASRLTAATAWTRHEPDLTGPVAFFGASTGAAAALLAAADLDGLVRAVVSRGGRPDLALDALPRVTAPTLLIVGGADDVVLRLNRTALARLRCERDLVVVRGATHLFEEPGALERVAAEARDWLRRHLDEDAPGLGAAR